MNFLKYSRQNYFHELRSKWGTGLWNDLKMLIYPEYICINFINLGHLMQ